MCVDFIKQEVAVRRVAIGNISNEIRENILGDFIKHLT
jgi:hypothetical protein